MVLLTVIFVLYFLLIMVLLTGWKKAMQLSHQGRLTKDPLISVVIPARNEETTVGNLLTTLAAQEYTNFEVIVVDDDSEDETLWAVSQCQMKDLQVIQNPGKGKKAAISAGVRAARGSIVVITDADCRVSPRWLKHMRASFTDPQVMLAFGGVRMEGRDSFFDSLQRMEFSSLIGTGASTSALGIPTMCNGANLAFRRKAFSAVKGYDDNLEIPSGDDEFLMRKINERYPGGVRFVPSAEAVVTTSTQGDAVSFFNQRIRWASKWKYNASKGTQALALSVVAFQLTFIVTWFYVFGPHILHALFLITIKMILEAAFLLQVCRFLQTPWSWLAFFCLQILYPLYAVGVGVASFFRPFEWKHRIFKPNSHVFR